jgi:hypothetical protein
LAVSGVFLISCHPGSCPELDSGLFQDLIQKKKLDAERGLIFISPRFSMTGPGNFKFFYDRK